MLMKTRQGKSNKSLLFNFYVVLQPATRSSRSKMFFKIGILKSFPKFIRKHLFQSLSFNKVVGLRPATLLKNRLWDRCFPVNFAKIFRAPFVSEHLRWLLLCNSYAYRFLPCRSLYTVYMACL